MGWRAALQHHFPPAGNRKKKGALRDSEAQDFLRALTAPPLPGNPGKHAGQSEVTEGGRWETPPHALTSRAEGWNPDGQSEAVCGGGLAGAKSDREFRRSLRGARAPKPRPWGGFLGCQTSAGSRSARYGVPSSVYSASKKGKGEIHFVTELGTRLHRPLWVTADSFFLGELTRRAGEDGRGALLELGNLTINSLTPGYT